MEINTILSLANTLDEETIVKMVCEQLDIDYEDIKARLPAEPDAEAEAAQKLLEGAVIDDEQSAEGSHTGAA